ncbi:MAG: PH domain-containing protein, partial [Ilumatobacteraceae bacterium]
MPYPQRLLNDGEEVALDIHPHWWFFAKSAAATLFTSVLFLWSAVALGDATWEKSLKWLFGATAIVSLIWLAVRWLAWRTTHFVITSDRLIARKGIIAKSG